MIFTFFVAASAAWNSTGQDYDKKHIKSILGYLKGGRVLPPKVFSPEELAADIPDSYDVHTAHPECAGEINDQSTCGSCWAVSSAETMTDRLCLAGRKDLRLSELDILSCCGIMCGFGCNGGFTSGAWDYFSGTGVVDGGPYGDAKHCTAYPFAPCAHHIKDPKYPTCGESQPTPECPSHCGNDETWDDAKTINSNGVYSVSDEETMKRELFLNGPVTVAFTVYSDFPNYKSGVYEADTSLEPLGGHAVECVGYGEENGIKYWRIKNSWNEDWGENGYFKIIRGRDECGIESQGVAALVKKSLQEVIV